MIEAKHSALAKCIFDIYLTRLLKKNFSGFYLTNQEALQKINFDRSLLITPNHFSWWDGFFIYLLNNTIIRKKFHILVIEETLKQYPFFKFLGTFGIDKKNPKDAAKVFEYINNLLNDNSKIVVFYPQGKLQPFENDEIELQEGIKFFAKKYYSLNALTVIISFMARYEDKRKPYLYAKIGEAFELKDLANNFESYKLSFIKNIKDLKSISFYNKDNFIKIL
jgi:hypothetical protein